MGGDNVGSAKRIDNPAPARESSKAFVNAGRAVALQLLNPEVGGVGKV